MGDSTIGYPEPEGYNAEIAANPDTIGYPVPLQPGGSGAVPGGSAPAAVTGGRVDARPLKRTLSMNKRVNVVQGTAASEDLGFVAHSVIIDNMSGQWLFEGASRRWVAPGTVGCVVQFPSGCQVLNIAWTAPPAITQPGGTAGSVALLIYCEDMLDPSPGTPLGAAGPAGAAAVVAGGSTVEGATGVLVVGEPIPTTANILDGSANVQASGTTALVTVPSGRTWRGFVGCSTATSVAAGGATATATAVVQVANGTGVATPASGTFAARVDVTLPAVAAAITPVAGAQAVAGQRLIVNAAGGTAVINLVATIVAGTTPQASGWAIGELL